MPKKIQHLKAEIATAKNTALELVNAAVVANDDAKTLTLIGILEQQIQQGKNIESIPDED